MNMKKGVQARLIVHQILSEIKKNNLNFDNLKIQRKINKFSENDKSLINTVCLNSMRKYYFVKKIIDKYLTKKPSLNLEILLLSAITQIVFLNFKAYAVINCSVEIAKKINLNPSLVNATLKNINREKSKLVNIKISYNDLPEWFQKNTSELKIYDKNIFLENFHNEPDLHLVFKDQERMKLFEEELFPSSFTSGFLPIKKKVESIQSFHSGNWWIQDFSSSYPLIRLNKKLYAKKIIDLCSAPGGKAFQILSKKLPIVLNDKSKNRLEFLKENLKRLKYEAKILNLDLINSDLKEKYDLVILDAPCSSLGTIRKNPEIFFKNNTPPIDKLVKLQKKLLDKAASLTNNGGTIIYMVCSFLKDETVMQIENFLNNNKDFSLEKNVFEDKKNITKILIKNHCINTLPTKIYNFNIDGYFASCLIKNSNAK